MTSALACLALLVTAGSAPAEPLPTLAVLYFDNNTGNPELDVLRKGWADMMTTDLAGAERVRVVEREKLQALLDEVRLQRSEFFNPQTAQELGHGLGATHVVTGAFAAVDPQLRVDVRLVEVASGRVVVGDHVVGEKSKLFDIQQQLVTRFLAALDRTLKPRPPALKPPDYGTVLDYSRALDAADQGKLEDASKAMAAVVRRAPGFALARQRHEDILRRLKEAAAKRVGALDTAAVELLQHAQDYLGTHALQRLSEQDGEVYLGYRALLSAVRLRELKSLLTPGHPACVLPGQEERAQALMRAYWDNATLALEELAIFERRRAAAYPGMALGDATGRIPPGEEARVAACQFSAPGNFFLTRLARDEFALMGRPWAMGDSLSFEAAPSLAVLDAQVAQQAWKDLQELVTWADARAQAEPRQVFQALQAREVLASAFLRHDRRDDAIAVWQETLDRYPTSPRFGALEQAIKQETGLERGGSRADLLGYGPALEACEDMGIRKGLQAVMVHRMFHAGLAAIPATAEEALARCPGNKSLVQYVLSHAALEAAAHKRCDLFDRFMQRYAEAGGPVSDVQGYRRNYAPGCPAP